jgi:hypothetical protein
MYNKFTLQGTVGYSVGGFCIKMMSRENFRGAIINVLDIL